MTLIATAQRLKRQSKGDFKGRHFDPFVESVATRQ